MSEPINNLEYLYAHLPARMVRDDQAANGGGAPLFLKRFLSHVGIELDEFDRKLDTFYQLIDPATAPIKFIDWWLYSLFGWAWFPEWFTVARRRAFYAAIAMHYARRGTLEGIQSFLAAFGLRVIVEAEGRAFDEQCFDEPVWTTNGPLGIIIRLFPEVPALNEDRDVFDEAVFEEALAAGPTESVQRVDLDELVRFCQPLAQIVMIEEMQFPVALTGVPLNEYGRGEYGEAGYG